jgi:serine/threonine-protein kinase
MEVGVRHLEVAITIDPALELARRDLSRAYVLLGEWEKSERVLEAFNADPDDSGRPIHRARLILWRRDKTAAEAVLRDISPTDPRYGISRKMLQVVVSGRSEPQFSDPDARSALGPNRGPGRRATLFAQVAAEVAAYLHDEQLVFTSLGKALDAGLIDLMWLDRCPLFDPYRGEMPFVVTRARLHERVRPIIEAYRAA